MHTHWRTHDQVQICCTDPAEISEISTVEMPPANETIHLLLDNVLE